MKNFILPILLFIVGLGVNTTESHAQQYKFKQVNSMMGMKSETTVYVKGMRKRTESGSGMMGMPATPTTIEQCDLQRRIKLNDKKKRYFIEPFEKETEEIEETEKPVVKQKTPVVKQPKEKIPPNKQVVKKGGVITNSYAIIDTGERKNMHGFTARHIWTVQKMMPSADACTMKDSMIIKTDGWYIDLPKFNCPISYKPNTKMLRQMQRQEEEETDEPAMPECKDSFVNRRSGKGKLGFILSETRTMKMGGKTQKTEFTTNIETMEFSTAKLDSMLFEIPPGYTEVKNESDLEEKINMADMMKEAFSKAKNMKDENNETSGEKPAGNIRIGIYLPTGDEQINAAELQTYLADILTSGKVEAVTVESEADAKKRNCDYALTTGFTKMKAGSKLGGMLKAIKNIDPNAVSSFNVEANLLLTKLSDGSATQDQKIDGKYDGKPTDAAKKALDEGSRKILKGLK
jgi:hypothetical protein